MKDDGFRAAWDYDVAKTAIRHPNITMYFIAAEMNANPIGLDNTVLSEENPHVNVMDIDTFEIGVEEHQWRPKIFQYGNIAKVSRLTNGLILEDKKHLYSINVK